MSIHVAILYQRYIKLILNGHKTVESRLTRTARAPFGRIQPGQRIYFKASCGPMMATAVAGAVRAFENLSPDRIDRLRKRWNKRVCGNEDYWQSKQHSRFATFVSLNRVEAIEVGPQLAPSRGLAWFALDDDLDPIIELHLSAGAIRNRYVYVPRGEKRIVEGQMRLTLPDARKINTALTDRGLIHWRGWGRYFTTHDVVAGDIVRLIRTGRRQYRVDFSQRRRGRMRK